MWSKHSAEILVVNMEIERITYSVGLSDPVLAPRGRGKETQPPKNGRIEHLSASQKECHVVLIQLILYIFHETDSLSFPYSQLIVHKVLIIRLNHYVVRTATCFGYT